MVGEPYFVPPSELPRIRAAQFREIYQCERDEHTGLPTIGNVLHTPEEQLRAKWKALGASSSQRDQLWAAFCGTQFGERRDEWVRQFDSIMGW